ncbi:DEAD/DEAH box helicase [Gloeothece verrucosa]|uniref:DEAD/DEAH box helicase domain protein n=1 Tax=Gloeothece verrucosa (strain PCC 7822) TaxID=497965 RepID=E0U565_GLOV7|nr:DEAD/DEAH box helicase [Gloeothece verrucosa]ADN12344.1 DEAD/DEAH box helicase domain protein [Gloeothece verrucosa PCC 7822]
MNSKAANSTLNLETLFPFELDQFQKKAITALEQGKSVVVCAPTGSGKTLVGEYAIYRALARGKRVFYTTPLKALSNQKCRDFQEKFGQTPFLAHRVDVGLITGDIVINPDAPIIVMTTEIFRNMLYETPIGEVGTSLENVETVVLDECHYISDSGRGTVWEESIIYCPPTIQLVALSATIGNPEELTDWINKVRQKRENKQFLEQKISTCELINSDFRPVPLSFYFSTKQGLFPLLNSKNTAINPRLLPKKNQKKQRRIRREECPTILEIVEQLQFGQMLPAIYVIFSRRGCDQAIQSLGSLNLVNREEEKELCWRLLVFFLAENASLQEQLLNYFAKNNPDLRDKIYSFLANNPDATEQLLEILQTQPEIKSQLFQYLASESKFIRLDHLEPLTRGIAAHHAGILPAWKELVEKLFELGLIKVVFATATLSAGINMPARTTVISALSKRTDEGHSMLTPSEFLQIAGRAGRRGMDQLGHVVTVQTPFEGAKEAAYLATAQPEPLKSCFTPSYGMVLNLLQKHSLEQAKDLLECSFAEYLARLKLAPEKQAIIELTTELTKLNIELAGISEGQINSYKKINETLREEKRLLKILRHQAQTNRKNEIVTRLEQLQAGKIVHLKGKHIKVSEPVTAVLIGSIPGSGKSPDFVCLGEDNRWYIAAIADLLDINPGSIPLSEIAEIPLPNLEKVQLGPWRKGDEKTAKLSQQIKGYAQELVEESYLIEQQQQVEILEAKLNNHPLQQYKNPGQILEKFEDRQQLQEELHAIQIRYQRHQSKKSYYWEEFLHLIEILQQFNALDGYTPTLLGEAAATIRGDNELWVGLVLMSGELEQLEPPHLAAAVSALITETLRPDTMSYYPPSLQVIEVFQRQPKGEETLEILILRAHLAKEAYWLWFFAVLYRLVKGGPVSLQETRRQLFQSQRQKMITIPVWLEDELMGLVEAWARGTEWQDLCDATSLDEGDLVRLLRRTVDLLWQIPYIPGVSAMLRQNAKEAIIAMKRFPV